MTNDKCPYCGAILNEDAETKGFTVICPECKYLL